MAGKRAAYNWGWRLSRAAGLDGVDADRLAKELDVRGVTCEMPVCRNVAFAVLPSGVTALVCFQHTVAYNTSPQVAAAIEAAVKYAWQGEMAITTSAAYVDADDFVVTTFVEGNDLLKKARAAASGAEKIMEQEARKLAAVAAAPVLVEVKTSEDKVRPTLNYLQSHNASDELFDPFVV